MCIRDSLEPLDMLVDRADADITAAGIGGLGFAETAKLRAENVIRSTEFFYKVIRLSLIHI